MGIRLLGAATALALLAAASPTRAAVVVTSIGNTPQGAVGGSTYITFEDVALNTTNNFTSNGFNFTGTGLFNGLITNTTTTFPLSHSQPKSDATHYLAIGSAIVFPSMRSETLTLANDYTKFGLYWGSIDTYNTVAFYNNGNLVYSLSGSGVPDFNPNADAESSNPRNRYVNFDFQGGLSFDQVVLQTTFRTFEVDNLALAGAVPEPSTWAMMLIGFGGIGFFAYRQSKKKSAAIAAL
jgi:hypothetical protein